MTVLTAFSTRFTLVQLSNLDQKKKGNELLFFFFLSCFTLNINVIKNPPVLELKCINRSPTSGLSCSRAQCARVDRFILWQIYKVAAEMNWNIVEIYEYGHTLFLIWKCWRLSCEPEVDSFGFLFTNVQNRAENLAVALTPTDECVCVFLSDIRLLAHFGESKTTVPKWWQALRKLVCRWSNKQVNNILSQQLTESRGYLILIITDYYL